MLFETFDRLYLLAEGQCIYRGLTTRLVDFLSSLDMNCPTYYNPADYGVNHFQLFLFTLYSWFLAVIDIASGKYGYMIDKMANKIQDGRCDEWDRETEFSNFGAGIKSLERKFHIIDLEPERNDFERLQQVPRKVVTQAHH